MSRRRAKTDANQKEIVKDLRAIGCTVADLSGVGKGVPDLLVGHGTRNYLLEVKNPKGLNRMTKDQIEWHEVWRGSVLVVTSIDDAIRQMGLGVNV